LAAIGRRYRRPAEALSHDYSIRRLQGGAVIGVLLADGRLLVSSVLAASGTHGWIFHRMLVLWPQTGASPLCAFPRSAITRLLERPAAGGLIVSARVIAPHVSPGMPHEVVSPGRGNFTRLPFQIGSAGSRPRSLLAMPRTSCAPFGAHPTGCVTA